MLNTIQISKPKYILCMDPGESCSGMSFKELLLGDLRLDPSQWEDRSPPPPPATGPGGPETSQYCEVDALVSLNWYAAGSHVGRVLL